MSAQFFVTCQPIPMENEQLEVKFGLVRLVEGENPYITLQKAFKFATETESDPNLFTQPAGNGLSYIMEEGAISKNGNVILAHYPPKGMPFSTGGMFFIGRSSKSGGLPFTQESYNAMKEDIDRIITESVYVGVVGE